MTATAKRQQLHNYLELAADKKIQAIYTMVENEIDNINASYTDDLKKKLQSRYSDYKSGKQMIGQEDSVKRIEKILKNGSKK